MRLAAFIAANLEAIVDECEAFARTLLPAASGMDREALRDHAAQMLVAIATDMRVPQSALEQEAKSKGLSPTEDDAPDTAAQTHGTLRAASGFDVNQTAAEYRALRAAVIRLWLATAPVLGAAEVDELIRFNEAMDQELAESLQRFARAASHDRDLFLGVLSHELRTPLATISASSYVVDKAGADLPPVREAAARIQRSSKRIEAVLNDLLEFVRSGSGGMRVTPRSLRIDELAQRVAREVEAAFPGLALDLVCEGDMHAVWDEQRIAQALSNLVTNAVKYGTPGETVRIRILGNDEGWVSLRVANRGAPIPAAVRATLFSPLVRGTGRDATGVSLGLGLYIVREIARAHGGDVELAPPEADCTIFTMRLPRVCDPSQRIAFGRLGRQTAGSVT
jgi:signal transduction histidine kinase